MVSTLFFTERVLIFLFPGPEEQSVNPAFLRELGLSQKEETQPEKAHGAHADKDGELHFRLEPALPAREDGRMHGPPHAGREEDERHVQEGHDAEHGAHESLSLRGGGRDPMMR